MKYKINSWMILCLILFVTLFVQANGFIADLQEQDKIIAQLQQQDDMLTINELYTLIRTTEDYTYLKSFSVDRDKWEHADVHTDINGVTWREIIEDGYIKVYAEGHVMPDSVHWYAPY